MIKIDLFVQTLMLICGLALAVTGIFDKDGLIWLLSLQLLVGPWQMISCGISLIVKGPLFREKLTHFVVACSYLFALTYFEFDAAYAFYFMTIPAWALAVFYYVLTWKRVLMTRNDRNRFLPHLSF